jgi:hypothetical protein
VVIVNSFRFFNTAKDVVFMFIYIYIYKMLYIVRYYRIIIEITWFWFFLLKSGY